MGSYVICCDSEKNTPISNKHDFALWQALEKLVESLNQDLKFSNNNVLFAWKSPHHISGAREPYAWRAAIEEIKNSDLSSKCKTIDTNKEMIALMMDKPVMLKIAGEVTNSLLHSYNSGHRITFSQYDSKVPS